MARSANQTTKHKSMSYTKFGYIFIAPFVLVYCIFSLYPLLTTFWYTGANMQTTTADFWGFSDKEVYYDRYLDLTAIYTDDFEANTGVSKSDYDYIRYFFSLQNSVDMYKPMNIEGLQAIVNNGAQAGTISQATIDKVQTAINNSDLSAIDSEAIAELKAWQLTFSDLSLTISNGLNGVNKSIQAITESGASEEEESEPITSADIIASSDFTNFVSGLSSLELTAGQEMLMAYLDAYVAENCDGVDSVAALFAAVEEGTIAVEEPTVYYVASRLDTPNATTAEGSVDGISVPFLADLKTYLATNSWADIATGLSSYANLEAYISGEKELHDDEAQLLADLKTLESYGIISVEGLEEQDGALVPSSVEKDNLIGALDTFITTNYQSNETALAAARQVGALSSYENTRSSGSKYADLVAKGIYIDKYLTVTAGADFDISKYNEFKAAIGLSQSLSMDAYNRMDQARKDKNVEKAQKTLEEQQALLPDAQAAVDAVASYAQYENATPKENPDEYALYREYTNVLGTLRSIESKITKAEDQIANPEGILTKVNAKAEYLYVGFDNFKAIFANTTRFNNVAGAFVSTAIMWVIGFVPQIILALVLSAWFTDTKLKLKGLGLMKAMMYLPNVITAVTVAVFFRRIFSYSTGAAASASQLFLDAIGAPRYNFFESPWATRLIICFINFWMWYGNTMIVLISGITSINESLYESAQIDGANSFQTYTKITLPLLRPIVLYTLVTSLIGGLQMYDIPQNVNMNPALVNFNGTMIRSTRTVLMYVNQQAFGKQDIKQVGIASSVSIILFVVTTILSVVIFYLMRDKDAAKAAKAKKLARKAGK